MPNQESNHLSCGLEPRFKLLITPVIQTYTFIGYSNIAIIQRSATQAIQTQGKI